MRGEDGIDRLGDKEEYRTIKISIFKAFARHYKDIFKGKKEDPQELKTKQDIAEQRNIINSAKTIQYVTAYVYDKDTNIMISTTIVKNPRNYSIIEQVCY